MSEGVCYPDFEMFSLVFTVFKNVGERSAAKTYHPVSFLSVFSEVFEKLVNDRIIDYLEEYGHLYAFQYGFKPS